MLLLRCQERNGRICAEGLAEINELERNYEDFVHPKYTVESTREIINCSIGDVDVNVNCVINYHDLQRSNPVVIPPFVRRPIGRKRSTRLKRKSRNKRYHERRFTYAYNNNVEIAFNANENVTISRQRKCTLCGLNGHVRNNCQNPHDGRGHFISHNIQNERNDLGYICINIGKIFIFLCF
jgi:hypothetical protein